MDNPAPRFNHPDDLDENSYFYESEHDDGRPSGRKFVPVEFAKQHILKVEEDMKKLHDRHVKLMREMDENYNLIEQETQDYYIEFLSKWKELAKSKIANYRQQCEVLIAEKVQVVKNKDLQIENLNEVIALSVKDREKLMREYGSEVAMRETEIESLKIRFEEDLIKKEKEKTHMRQMYEEKLQRQYQA